MTRNGSPLMNKPVPLANMQSAVAVAMKRARTVERRRTEARYIPTKAQIRRACLEIQNYWTEQEERNRGGCGGCSPAYTLPVVDERLFDTLPAEIE